MRDFTVLTVAEEQVPHSEQGVERQVSGVETHQPISGKHKWLHTVFLQVPVCGGTYPAQHATEHARVKQYSLL